MLTCLGGARTVPGLSGSPVETRPPGLSACPDCCWVSPNDNGSPIRGSFFRGVSLTESVKRYSSVTLKTPQAAQKGPAARRRPRAAREAYSLYVRLGGGLRPPSETSTQDAVRAAGRPRAGPRASEASNPRSRRHSRRSKVEHSHVGGRAPDRKSQRPALNVPLGARALPAPRTGGGLGGGRRGPLR